MTGTAIQTETKTQIAKIEGLYEGERGEKLAKALPRGMHIDRMKRIHLAAFAENPKLAECNVRSIALSIQQLCLLGWELGGPAPLAYLVPYKDTCQLIPSYRGLIELARRAHSVVNIVSDVVREGDEFSVSGDLLNKSVRHVKAASGRGACTHAYAGYKLANGEQVWEIWTAAEVDEHRKRYSPGSDRKDSAWQTSWDAMAKKTVLKRPLLDGRIRLSMEDLRLVARETEIIDGEPVVGVEHALIDHEPDAVLDQSPPIGDDLDVLRKEIQKRFGAAKTMTALDSVDEELNRTYGGDENQMGLLIAEYAARREEIEGGSAKS